MITAVDTSVLIDIFGKDPLFGAPSAEALRKCMNEGHVVACDVVWAETAAVFPSSDEFNSAIRALPITFSLITEDSAVLAGEMWRVYRKRGGTRLRVMPDFLVAAHAQRQCDRLLTRDKGFHREYFSELSVIRPSIQ